MKKSKKGGFRSSVPIADVPYLGLVGWSVPLKVATLPEESGQEIQPYSPIMQQNSTHNGLDNDWKTGMFINGIFNAFFYLLYSHGQKNITFLDLPMRLTLILHWVSADPAGFRYGPPPSPVHWLPVNSRDIADIQGLNSRDSSLDCSLMSPRRDLGPKHCSLCGKVCLFASKKKRKILKRQLFSYVTQ